MDYHSRIFACNWVCQNLKIKVRTTKSSILRLILHLAIESLSICTERVVYTEGNKITFSPGLLSFHKSVIRCHINLLSSLIFISFGSVSERIVENPSSFHPLSSIFEYGRHGNYFAYTRSAMDATPMN